MRKATATLLLILILWASTATVSLPVEAETKTLVVPDDYPTIEAAIQNSTSGDTVYVKSGFYEEKPLKINKSIAIIGEGPDSTQISFNPPFTDLTVNILERYRFYDDPIDVDADSFTLSGFTINSTGGRITIAGNRTTITNNVLWSPMYLNGGSYSSILENSFNSDVGFNFSYGKVSSNHFWWGYLYGGGQFTIFSSNDCHWGAVAVEGHDCLITNNLVEACDWFKINGDNHVISKNTLDHTAFGLSVSGTNSKAFLNQISHCGIGLNPSIGSIVYANSISNCGWGIDTTGDLISLNGTKNTLYHNNFVNNRYQTGNLRDYGTDYLDNGEEGNYWNDYGGRDANGDGIGDAAYVIDDNRSDRYPLMKPFNLTNVEDIIPDWAAAPTVQLTSPQNISYQSNVMINYSLNKQADTVTYSLDEIGNQSITGNVTLSGLPSGRHNVTVYAKDVFGNIGASETISFTIAVPLPLVPVVVASIASIGVAAAIVTIYMRRKRKENEKKGSLLHA